MSYLLEVHQKQENGEITLSALDQERLNALLAFYREALEFSNSGQPLAVSSQQNSGRLHVMTKAGKDYRFSFDLKGSQRVITHLVDNLSDEQPIEGNMLVTTLYPHLYGQVGETFAFTTDIAHRFVYGEIFEDFFPDETKIRQLEGNLKNRTAINAYLKFNLPWFELQLGQDTLQWGPGYHDSLLISKNPLAMDMIKLQAKYESITFTAFTGILEDMATDINDKYISGHRVEGYFWDRFGFGLSEVVVYGNRFRAGVSQPGQYLSHQRAADLTRGWTCRWERRQCSHEC